MRGVRHPVSNNSTGLSKLKTPETKIKFKYNYNLCKSMIMTFTKKRNKRYINYQLHDNSNWPVNMKHFILTELRFGFD